MPSPTDTPFAAWFTVQFGDRLHNDDLRSMSDEYLCARIGQAERFLISARREWQHRCRWDDMWRAALLAVVAKDRDYAC